MDGDKTIVLVAVRAEAERHGWLHPMLVAWLLSLPSEPSYGMIVELIQGFSSLAASANACAEVFLEKHPEADWLCIQDNDTVPPPDLLRMLDHAPADADILSPLNYQSYNERTIIQAGYYVQAAGKKQFVPLLPEGRPQEVDRVGGGTWFIRRRTFERMERPYFKMLFDPDTCGLVVSDDIWFQHVAQAQGSKMYCDSRFSTSHYHTRDVSLVE